MDDHQTSEKLGLSDDAVAVQPTVFAPDALFDAVWAAHGRYRLSR